MSDMLELRNFVGGEHVDGVDGSRSDLVDPSTGEVFGSAPVSGDEDVDRAFRVAAEAFETWRETTPAQRQRALLGLADLVEEQYRRCAWRRPSASTSNRSCTNTGECSSTPSASAKSADAVPR